MIRHPFPVTMPLIRTHLVFVVEGKYNVEHIEYVGITSLAGEKSMS